MRLGKALEVAKNSGTANSAGPGRKLKYAFWASIPLVVLFGSLRRRKERRTGESADDARKAGR
jgi:hypothetical protein